MCLRRVKLTPARRLKRRSVRPGLVIALTGSIAMGKSTAANFLRGMRIPVFDADAVVHQLMGPRGKAAKAVAARFPGVHTAKGIDRKALGAIVFHDAAALKDLEAILHPLVQQARTHFLRQVGLRRAPVVVLDIPLLYEAKVSKAWDFVVVVSAPAFLQRQRALARPGMSRAKFNGIVARQWPDARKRALADAVVPSGLGKRETLRRLQQFLKVAKKKKRHTLGGTHRHA
jgi:dephospho-CoA kinase